MLKSLTGAEPFEESKGCLNGNALGRYASHLPLHNTTTYPGQPCLSTHDPEFR